MNAPTRNVQQRPRDPKKDAIAEARNQIGQMKQSFIEVLPKTIASDKFIRTASTLLYLKPELTAPNVNRQSLLLALVRCAADGLMPDGREATITIFNEGEDDQKRGDDRRQKQAVYIPMYQGLIKQIRNSGELKEFGCHIVYANDFFKYTKGDEEKLEHEDAKGARGEPIKVYAVLKTKDGGIYRAVLDVDDIKDIQSRSQMGKKNKGPWKTDWKEMWKKSAIRRISKHAPKSAELDRYLEIVRDQDDPVGQTVQRMETAPMPDGEPDEQLHTQLFQLKTLALEAMADEEDPQIVSQVWDSYVNECTKINQEPELEVESKRNDRLEALKQKQLK